MSKSYDGEGFKISVNIVQSQSHVERADEDGTEWEDYEDLETWLIKIHNSIEGLFSDADLARADVAAYEESYERLCAMKPEDEREWEKMADGLMCLNNRLCDAIGDFRCGHPIDNEHLP